MCSMMLGHNTTSQVMSEAGQPAFPTAFWQQARMTHHHHHHNSQITPQVNNNVAVTHNVNNNGPPAGDAKMAEKIVTELQVI